MAGPEPVVRLYEYQEPTTKIPPVQAAGAILDGVRALERVKGIEPSYSAWKAAALPLSYTRITGSLTRPGGGLNCPGAGISVAFGLSALVHRPGSTPARLPLTAAPSPPILPSSATNERR